MSDRYVQPIAWTVIERSFVQKGAFDYFKGSFFEGVTYAFSLHHD